LTPLESDPCTMVKHSAGGKVVMIVELHCDGLLMTGTAGSLHQLTRYLSGLYKMRVYDVTEEYVVLQFDYSIPKSVKLHQSRFIEQLAMTHLTDEQRKHAVPTPLVPTADPLRVLSREHATAEESTAFLSILGGCCTLCAILVLRLRMR
jgi:hypothetical protein